MDKEQKEKRRITVSDLKLPDLLRTQVEEGRLFFNKRRAIIMDVEALSALRQQLIEALGEELAMGVITRFGYTHGSNDAKMLKESFNWETELDWLAAGPFLHTLEGIVHVTPLEMEFDRETGHFFMRALWLNSYEAEEHVKRYGVGNRPVCWTLTGYASGYASRFFGQDVLAIETECIGMGHARCRVEIRPVKDWGPEVSPYIKALKAVDVTNQLQQLQMIGARFRDMALSNADWVWETDEHGRYTYCSENIAHVLGYRPQEVLGKYLFDFMPASESARVGDILNELIATKSPIIDLESLNVTREGREVVLLISGVPVLDDSGNLKSMRGVVRDITERRRMQDITEERLRLAELGRDINFALNRKGTLRETLQRCTDALLKNLEPSFARIWTLGTDPSTLELQASSGLPTRLNCPHSTIPLDSALKIAGIARERKPHMTNAVSGDPRIDDQEWARKEGFVAFAGYPLLVENHLLGVVAMFSKEPFSEFTLKALEVVAGNIAMGLENKTREESLHKSELQFRQLSQEFNAILDAIPDHLSLQTVDATIRWANQAAVADIGKSPDEIIGQKCEVFGFCLPDCRKCPLWRSVQTGKPEREILTDSRGKIWDLRAVPIKDEEGTVISVVILGQNITEHRKLEEQLQQSQKMEAIGALAGGIAHDFNNVLSPIIGYTEIVLSEVPKGSKIHNYLTEVLAAGNRAKGLVQQILAFSRKSEHERRPIQIQPIIHETLRLLRSTLPTTIQIRANIDQDCGSILADPIHIHQVLMNLCTNAYHAMRKTGGILSVTLRSVQIETYDLNIFRDLVPGNYLRLEVSDTGHGIDPQIMSRIFEPYFTTKSKEEGSGLGLSVVHALVRNQGGHIAVYSEPGAGTTFCLHFPLVAEEKPDTAETLLPPQIIPRGTERILLVDDEQQLTAMNRSILESLGYEVEAFTNSLDALAAFRSHPDKYQLVITDQTMPDLTGIQLAKEILTLQPDIPIILCTGFSEVISAEDAKARGIRKYLMKPISIRDMAEAIRKVLESVNR